MSISRLLIVLAQMRADPCQQHCEAERPGDAITCARLKTQDRISIGTLFEKQKNIADYPNMITAGTIEFAAALPPARQPYRFSGGFNTRDIKGSVSKKYAKVI